MRPSVKRKLKTYILSIAIPLAVGSLAAIITRDGMAAYAELNQPVFAPPGWVFPIAWTILYVLMGISAGLVYLSDDDCRRDALRIYALQLFLNFGWPILFFGFQQHLIAFVWLVVFIAVIVVMIALFFAIRPKAAYLQIPLFCWVAFAAYLNFSIWLLNK